MGVLAIFVCVDGDVSFHHMDKFFTAMRELRISTKPIFPSEDPSLVLANVVCCAMSEMRVDNELGNVIAIVGLSKRYCLHMSKKSGMVIYIRKGEDNLRNSINLDKSVGEIASQVRNCVQRHRNRGEMMRSLHTLSIGRKEM